MAKLSKHGHEIARVIVRLDYSAPTGGESWIKTHVEWERDEFSYRSDGHVMKRNVCKFRDRDDLHDGGWRMHKRFKDRSINAARIHAVAYAHYEQIENRDGELPDTTLTAEFKEGAR